MINWLLYDMDPATRLLLVFSVLLVVLSVTWEIVSRVALWWARRKLSEVEDKIISDIWAKEAIQTMEKNSVMPSLMKPYGSIPKPNDTLKISKPFEPYAFPDVEESGELPVAIPKTNRSYDSASIKSRLLSIPPDLWKDIIPPTLTIEHLTAMAAAEIRKPTMPDKPQNTLTPDNIVEHIRMAGEVLNEQRVPDKRVFCPWCGTEARNLRRVDSGEAAYECACTDAKNAERMMWRKES